MNITRCPRCSHNEILLSPILKVHSKSYVQQTYKKVKFQRTKWSAQLIKTCTLKEWMVMNTGCTNHSTMHLQNNTNVT